jgi:intracellular septation protein
MKTILDFLPFVFFFGAFKLYDIYVGTAVLMAATVLQMLVVYRLDGRLQTMQKITLLLVLVFGTLTLVLHDERFIKWKPTVLYAAMSIALAIALWVMHKNVLKLMLSSQLELPEMVWHKLNLAWMVYTAFMSALNAYVVLNYSTEAWVSFKVWGYVFPLTFLVAQGFYIAPHLKADQTPPEDGASQ